MNVLASMREFPLLVHVLGAMILVGGTLTATAALSFARGDTRLLRLGYWSLLAVSLPGYVVMRIGAQWLYSREQLEELPEDPTWIGIGFGVADVGLLLLLIGLAVGGVGVRRLRGGGGIGLLKISTVISLILLAAYIVTIWAMSAKPG